MSEPLVIEPPNFNPEEDDDVEYFCLRAPAHLDVTDVLNGVTLNIDTNILEPSSAGHSNEIISTFKAKSDGQEYALTFADGKELEGIRLLVPDYDDEEQLVPFKPFKGQFNLTSVVGEAGSDGSGNVQSDLLLAPAAERAPKPAFELSGNGAVDKMRLAYIPGDYPLQLRCS